VKDWHRKVVKSTLNDNSLAELVKTCRITSGLSQIDLAERLNIDRSYISKFENGREVPNCLIMKRIGTVTGCSDLVSAYFSENGMPGWEQLQRYKLAMTAVISGVEIVGSIHTRGGGAFETSFQ